MSQVCFPCNSHTKLSDFEIWNHTLCTPCDQCITCRRVVQYCSVEAANEFDSHGGSDLQVKMAWA